MNMDVYVGTADEFEDWKKDANVSGVAYVVPREVEEEEVIVTDDMEIEDDNGDVNP
jgi:hypothetical protein